MGVFDGLTICVGGNIRTKVHKSTVASITEHGGTVITEVTDPCHYLVQIANIPAPKSVKYSAALEQAVPIVTETWLQASIDQDALCEDAAEFLSKPSQFNGAPAQAAKVARVSGRGKKRKADEEDDEDEPDAEKDKDEAEDEVKSKAAAKKSKPAKGTKQDAKKSKSAAKKGTAKDEDEDAEDVEEEEEEQDAKPVLKTVIVKGRAPVDEHCPYHTSHHVYQDSEGNVWDAMLNQTNIGANNNKFYIIQLLQSDSNSQSFLFWNRWGRVGVTGQNNKGVVGDLKQCQTLYENKFKDKSGNHWSDRAAFESHRGKYTLIERDYSNDEEDQKKSPAKQKNGDDDDDGANMEAEEEIESKLSPEVQRLISLICDVQMMKQSMMELGYDANKMPLGRLSKEHVQRGYEVLTELSNAINSGSSYSVLEQLSSQFYTIIPHSVGFNRLPVLRTKEDIKRKLELCQSLADIEVAVKLMKASDNDSNGEKVNEIDRHYAALKCEISPLDPTSSTVQMIKQYIANTHGKTHTGFELELEHVYALDREGEHARFDSEGFNKDTNRQLLWHGSRLTNWTGILSQGLRIAPPSAPVTGYMFGKGVYLANAVSKSAGYCFTNKSAPMACMLLCEAALGESNQLFHADYNASDLPAGKLSTHGIGQMTPDPKATVLFEDGLKVPSGKLVEAKGLSQSPTLLYDELIVYDVAQIRMKYLLLLKFKHRY